MGTMYSAFTEKDAVLSFVIYATLDKNYLSSEITLPIKPIEASKLIILLRKGLDNMTNSIMNITDSEGKICKDFSKLIEELFDLFADYLLAFNNIETNAGQKQKISIARALLKNAPILILDEPTAALDADSESKILNIILSLKQERKCILLITHKNSTLRIADKILHIKDGKVSEI